MRVAIFGGTGFVGSHLIDALHTGGHQVSLQVRSGSEHKLLQTDIWRKMPGNLDNIAAIDANIIGCDAVIYCVGILREFPKRNITFENTQYEGVVRVADSALKNRVRRFLLMSANGIKLPGTPYQETKKRAEEYVFASALDATVFRPSVIFGDPRGMLEIATQLHRDMVAPPVPAIGFFSGTSPKKGQILMSPVHVDDVAQAFVNALADKSTIGKCYELGGPEVLSWQEMIRRIAKTVGRSKWILPMPVSWMKLGARLFDWLPFFPVTRDQLIMLAEGNTADPQIIASLIGRSPQAFVPANLSYLKH